MEATTLQSARAASNTGLVTAPNNNTAINAVDTL
jgi:hypothetical protein